MPLRLGAGRRGAHRLRHAEVRHHRHAARQQHVVGLHVTMHDALGVRVRERADHVAQDAHRLRDRQLALAADPGPEGLARDERHDEVGQPVGFAGGEQGHDVRMLELGGELDLAPEPVDVHAGRELGEQHLDHDLSAERLLVGEEDVRHAAPAELAVEHIRLAERGLELIAEGRDHRHHGGRRWNLTAGPGLGHGLRARSPSASAEARLLHLPPSAPPCPSPFPTRARVATLLPGNLPLNGTRIEG